MWKKGVKKLLRTVGQSLMWSCCCCCMHATHVAAQEDLSSEPRAESSALTPSADPNELARRGEAGMRAGAAAVDITPRQWPVRVNGQFLEGQADRAVDPLFARCLFLQSGELRVALVVVDSCMIPTDVCDRAKQIAEQRTGIPRQQILLSATHNHSSPSVMDYCLGSRSDPYYTAYLPTKVAEAIERAAGQSEPAELGMAVVHTDGFTANRRWVTRTDVRLSDPFGQASVHAMMHPGYDNPDYTGPSGPIDPALTLVSVRSLAGRPMALLGNFSMHYFGGHAGLSADYCGLFAQLVQERFAQGDARFVGMLSQGTSGDLWWGDYSRPKVDRTMEEYTQSLVDLVEPALRTMEYRANLELAMVERRVTLGRRSPAPERLEWARSMLQAMADRRPANLPEVYAEQAIYLHEHPTTEIVLQALRVGDLGITAMPNEVYALTGLKLKLQSPLPVTMNIELANGADGYIPPPEQHRLGGYTTWPARTASLEVEAEPKIVENLLQMLEELAARPRRAYAEPAGSYAQTVLADRPLAYYRMAEWAGDRAMDVSGQGRHAQWQGDVCFFLPGPPGPAFANDQINRAVHSAGASLTVPVNIEKEGTIECWIWNGLVTNLRDKTGTILTWGDTKLRLTGKADAEAGCVQLEPATGKTSVERHRWHHLVLVRSAQSWQVYLNGQPEVTVDREAADEGTDPLVLGGQVDAFPFEGRIDEVAVYDRALRTDEIQRHYDARK